MRIRGAFFAMAAAIAVFTGCVSPNEYRGRLGEIKGLKSEVASLYGKLRAAEVSHAVEAGRLKAENEELGRKEAGLLEANAELAHRMESGRLALVKESTQLKSRLTEYEYGAKKLEDELKAKAGRLEKMEKEFLALKEERRKTVLEKKAAVDDLKKTFDELVTELKEEITKGRVAVKRLKGNLSLSLGERVLFDSGSAEVKGGGRKVLDRVAAILRKVTGRQIRIEGHTDNVKIGSKLMERFPTNWELSAARATNVVRYLHEHGKIDPRLLSAAGYSEHRPVASNKTEEGRARNRRIEIVLIPVDIDRVGAGEGAEGRAGE